MVEWWDTCLFMNQIQRMVLSDNTCVYCKNCLLLEFQNCLNISESESNDNFECEENDWLADDESNKKDH